MRSLTKIIDIALKEDIHKGDITTEILIPKSLISTAYIITREKCVICGIHIVERIFKKLDRHAIFKAYCKDGDEVLKNKNIIRIKAKTRALLTGERVALNFLSHASAIGTKTRAYVKQTAPYPVKIYDTRKTTPCLRALEKMAVRHGGGYNHRHNLSEVVIIKDNHWIELRSSYRKSLKELVLRAKEITKNPVVIEVENLRHFKEVIKSEPDIILLDNMNVKQIRKAVRYKRKFTPDSKTQLEVSGNVTLKNIRSIAKTGIDRISSGALTHTRKAVDLSLEIIP